MTRLVAYVFAELLLASLYVFLILASLTGLPIMVYGIVVSANLALIVFTTKQSEKKYELTRGILLLLPLSFTLWLPAISILQYSESWFVYVILHVLYYAIGVAALYVHLKIYAAISKTVI